MCSRSTTGSDLTAAESIGKMTEGFMHHREIRQSLTQLFAGQSFKWIQHKDPRAYLTRQGLGHPRADKRLIIHNVDVMISGQMHELSQPGGRRLGLRRQTADTQLHESIASRQIPERGLRDDAVLLPAGPQQAIKLSEHRPH